MILVVVEDLRDKIPDQVLILIFFCPKKLKLFSLAWSILDVRFEQIFPLMKAFGALHVELHDSSSDHFLNSRLLLLLVHNPLVV